MRFWWERSEVAAQKVSEVQYMCITLFSGSVIHADVQRNLASYLQGVNFLCDVLVCRATPPLLPYLRKHCLMPSSHTKLCSSFYFGCQLCQASLHIVENGLHGNDCNCEFLLCFFLPVSLGFFDDILIPHHSLQHPRRLYPTLCMHKIAW